MNRYEQDWRDDNDRQSRRYRRDEGLLERIKNDVKAWFDDDDDEQHVRHAGYRGSTGNLGQGQTWRSDDNYSRDDDYDRRRNYGSARSNRFGEDYGRSGDYSQDRRYGSDEYGSSGRSGQRGGSGMPVWLYSEYYWVTPGPHSGVGPKNFERSSDALKERVCERLQGNGEIDAADIEVQVESGEVTLTGTVKDRQQKRLAEDCAESVYGVRDVHNRLSIQREDKESHSRSTDYGAAKRSVN